MPETMLLKLHVQIMVLILQHLSFYLFISSKESMSETETKDEKLNGLVVHAGQLSS